MGKSLPLTPEQDEFYRSLLIRATSNQFGQPYIAYAFFALTPYNSPGLRTMGVDKRWNVYIDFDYMMEIGIEEATKFLNHEPWHLLRNHTVRFEGLDALPNGQRHSHKAWNIAGDLTINGDIPDLVPEVGCFPGKGPFKDFAQQGITEDYYIQLMKKAAEEKKCSTCGRPKQGDQQGQDQQGQDQQGQDQQGQDQQGHGAGGDEWCDECGAKKCDGSECSADGDGDPCPDCVGKGGQYEPNCGSGAGGDLGEYELDQGEAPGLSEQEAEDTRKAVAQQAKEWAQSNPGKLPGSVQVWADDTLAATPPDWRQLVRASIKRHVAAWTKGKMDYNRRRPARRQPVKKIIYPSMQAPKPRFAVGIDTSGSHLHKLGVVVDQITDLSKKMGVRGRDLLAFGVDVNITDTKIVNDPKKVLDDMVGGGGTDMSVGIEQLSKLNREGKADIGILLTDLQTGWPSKRPDDNMRYLICGIVDTSNEWEMKWVADAEAAIGDWADIIVIDVANNGQKRAGR